MFNPKLSVLDLMVPSGPQTSASLRQRVVGMEGVDDGNIHAAVQKGFNT